MKKIVVMSDNHGDDSMMKRILDLEPDGDYYVHCGDSDTQDIRNLEGFICVQGNNDWFLDLPRFATFTCEDLHILITHGQFYGYFNREKLMKRDLDKYDCTVMLSGHSHMPNFTQMGKYTFVNPGSTNLPRGGSETSYCVLTVNGSDIECEFKTLE